MSCLSCRIKASHSSYVSSIVFGRRLSLVCFLSHGHFTRSSSRMSRKRPKASICSCLVCFIIYYFFVIFLFSMQILFLSRAKILQIWERKREMGK
ncbi:hypothetical protein JCM6292_3447 [Bacteroides pyogenes JCM 6292]|uniref:Uncharacterized protein n=1 Tax=Bacteroides pyogenes JCM 6292 TaxID=1235809 RepID=W4PCP7_9BACE|nr:hypothetical protein JCM6292_3447 [Bacteroides pyogenes JCM 6292]